MKWHMKEIVLEADIRNIYKLGDFLEDSLSELNVSMAEDMKINLVMEELFVNIANYAYAPDHGWARIQTEVFPDQNAIEITVIDQGVEFNPLSRKDPDVTVSAKERGIGGLGIYMAKTEVDEMKYRRQDDENILWLRKEFGKKKK